MSNRGPIQREASDFSQFVYCGLLWAYKKNGNLNSRVKAKRASYDKSSESYYREEGKRNEPRCIEWVLNNNNLSKKDIIYDGTNDKISKSLLLDVMGMKVKGKPDLIVKINGKVILFEFKSVGNPNHLGSQFDNNRAQIWCYRKIINMHIDKFYLFQYFRDPFYTGLAWGKVAYRITEQFAKEESEYERMVKELLPDNQFEPNYFEHKFKNYVKATEYITEGNRKIENLLKGNSPKDDGEKRQKCYSCEYREIVPCPIGQGL